MTLIGAVRVELKGQQNICFGVGDEGFFQNSDDGIRLVAERQRAAYDVGIAAKFALPQTITQHHDLAPVGGVFLRGKGAAQYRGRAEQTEVSLRDMDTVYLFRTVAREVEARAAEVVGGDILEDVGLLLPDTKLGDGGAWTLALRRGEQELNNAIRVWVSERLEQYRVNHCENGGIDPDAQSQRSNRGKGESRICGTCAPHA